MQVAPSTGNSMVLKDDRQRVRDLLRETVTMLCKRGLSYNAQLSVEGLLGITLDDDEVFLVNIKETVQNPTSPSPLTVTQQDLMDSLSSSGEHSPTGSDTRADIVSRAVTPMHTFRGSGVRGKQRSRKRVWGQETRMSQQGDIRRMETQSSNESSSSMMGPPRKQQITKAVLPVVEDAISLQHSGIKQEPIDITADPCKEHCESQQSQNFDNSFASNVLDVDQPIEVSQNGADNVDGSAVCRLPLAVAVEGSQSDDRSLVEAIPGCSSWSETADESPGAKSHVTLCEDGCTQVMTKDRDHLTNHVDSEEEEADLVPGANVESDIVVVHPEAPEDSGVVTVHPEECDIVTVQPESPDDCGIVAVEPKAPKSSEVLAIQPQAAPNLNVSVPPNVPEENVIITSQHESLQRAFKGCMPLEIPQKACSMTIQPSPKENSCFVAIQPGASEEINNKEKNAEQSFLLEQRQPSKQPSNNEKFCIEEGEIVSPASHETLTSLGISPEQLAAAGFVLPIPGMTNPLGVNEIALTHLNHSNHANFSELQQNLLWYTQCMEAAGANIMAANEVGGGDGKNLPLQMLRCRTCGKQLSSARSLMLHENRHQGIYPFHCPICGKGFASNYNMRGHMAHHTNVREFKCHLCAAEYVYKQPLQKHYEKAHGIDVGYTELPIMRRLLHQ